MEKSDRNTVYIKDLGVNFFTEEGTVKAVENMNMNVPAGKTYCIVGESGCGKSVTARSIMRLIDSPGEIISGEIVFKTRSGEKKKLTALPHNGKEMLNIRGKEIGMIFQEPMSSLSPVYTIGNMMKETLMLKLNLTSEKAEERAIDLLEKVGIPQPAERMNNYSFQLSGGMVQRVMIAMAISCDPTLLIADEPTTALDVTTQAKILDLIKDLQQRFGMTVIFITHDLGVVAEIADEVLVMYLGKNVEHADVFNLFEKPLHPYTQGLLQSIPKLGLSGQEQHINAIPGMVPHPFNRPSGCLFHPRCNQSMDGICDQRSPEITTINGREVRCFKYTCNTS